MVALMGLFSRREPETVDNHPVVLDEKGVIVPIRDVSLEEVARNHEVIGVTDGVIMVRALADPETQRSMQAPPDMRELGTTGMTRWGAVGREDYNASLRGNSGFDEYDKMRRGDAMVRATLRLMKTPITSARWFMQPGTKDEGDRKIAEEVWRDLTKHMEMTFPSFLNQALLSLDYGFYAFEKVFVIDPDDGRVRWKYFSSRHPRDLYEWEFDRHGQMTAGIWYKSPVEMSHVRLKYPGKLFLTNFDAEGGDPAGVSVLRSAYKHWYYKENLYKIDAIQKERHGIGIPVIQLPVNFNDNDKALAGQMGRNLRTNERAHVVLPPMWELSMLRLEGNPVDALASAKHHNDMIAMNILAVFLTGIGDFAEEAQMNLFLRSLRYVAESIAADMTHNITDQVVYWNHGDVECPELKVRRIGDTVDWRTLSFAVRNLVGAKVLTPDDRLEEWFRDEMDLSQWDPETSREIAPAGVPEDEGFDGNGQAIPGQAKPPRVGLPRQSAAGNMQQARNAGSGRVGQDKSGG